MVRTLNIVLSCLNDYIAIEYDNCSKIISGIYWSQIEKQGRHKITLFMTLK